MATESELQRRADSGDAEAQVGLAVLLDRRGRVTQRPSTCLGARLVVGRAAPFQPSEGARWVSAAAQQGMPEALSLMAVLATVSGDWRAAIQFMTEAGRRGHVLARE